MIGNFLVGGRLSQLHSVRLVLFFCQLGIFFFWSALTGILPPFSGEVSSFDEVSCQEPVAKALVQARGLVGRSSIPPQERICQDVQLSPEGGGVLPLLPAHRVHWWVPPHPHLHGLNTYLHSVKFCIGILNSVIQSVHKGGRMVSLDLKDAYLHVQAHPSRW